MRIIIEFDVDFEGFEVESDAVDRQKVNSIDKEGSLEDLREVKGMEGDVLPWSVVEFSFDSIVLEEPEYPLPKKAIFVILLALHLLLDAGVVVVPLLVDDFLKGRVVLGRVLWAGGNHLFGVKLIIQSQVGYYYLYYNAPLFIDERKRSSFGVRRMGHGASAGPFGSTSIKSFIII